MEGRRKFLSIVSLLPVLPLLVLTDTYAARLSGEGYSGDSVEPLVMGGDGNYPPFHYIDEDGEPAGFDVEMFKYVADYIGKGYEIRLGRWTDTLNDLAENKIDVVPMFISETRAERYEFTAPFLIRSHLVFGNRNARLIEHLSQLEDESVLVQAGSYAEDHLRKHYPGISLIGTSTGPEALQALHEGQADYALLAKWNALYSIRENGLEGIRTLSPPVLSAEYVFAVPKGRHELADRLNLALNKLREAGIYDRLYNTWLVNLESPFKYFRITVLIAAGLLLLLLIYLIYFYSKYRSSRQEKYKYIDSLKNESSKREKAEEEARYLAYYDRLTGLLNRNGFVRALDEHVNKAKAAKSQIGVCVLRLADLLTIEQIGGFDLGDLFILDVAGRLKSMPNAIAGRLDRDKFGLILTSVNNPADAEYQLNALIGHMEGKIEVSNIPFDIRSRAGLALYPEHGITGKYLLRAAELARHHAHLNKHHYKIYDLNIEPDPRNLTLLTDLREAIRTGELGWVFQPKVRLEDGVTVGAEMLARWQHKTHGFIAPNVFIALAEESGIISELTDHLVDRANYYSNEFQKIRPGLLLSINISGNDLENEVLVKKLISYQDGRPQPVCLEITETSVMRNEELIFSNIGLLRAAGYEFSLDDYGTGYSSLSYLRRLKPRELKIDREFVFSMLSSEENSIITRATINLCHSLNLRATAEGAEDQKTIDSLREMGCDMVQGYGIARPLPEGDFREWLRTA